MVVETGVGYSAPIGVGLKESSSGAHLFRPRSRLRQDGLNLYPATHIKPHGELVGFGCCKNGEVTLATTSRACQNRSGTNSTFLRVIVGRATSRVAARPAGLHSIQGAIRAHAALRRIIHSQNLILNCITSGQISCQSTANRRHRASPPDVQLRTLS